jgi:hypothetical protein
MSETFQCPKCGSQDTYMANKTIMGGIGGIYGNRSKNVMRPFCRSCDIEALSIRTIEKANKPKATRQLKPVEAFSSAGLLLVGVAFSYLGSTEMMLIGLGFAVAGALLAVFFLFKKRDQ